MRPRENERLVARTVQQGAGRLVFAHFMVGIVANRQSAADYDADMLRAKAYGIDAFALNIGTDSYNDEQLQFAYTSAENNGMKVFISFDFNWWTPGDAAAVGKKIAQYADSPAQLMVDGKAFVSTFAGDELDVNALREAAGTPLYFVPNFDPAKGGDIASCDGALNWMSWPNDGNNRAPAAGQNGTVQAGDDRYLSALNNKDYLAPVSPWFFTHYGPEVSYSKNWLFPGDLLWFDRWNDVLKLRPRFVEIITWNDYGESHYVGPLDSPHVDDGASQWVNDMPHDGWLDMAKPFIAAFKAGATSVNDFIESDQLIYWYRPQPKTADCDATDTCMTGSASGNYYIGRPNGFEVVSDEVFVVALLKESGTVEVTSGSNSQTFEATAGASSFSIPMGAGKQQFALTRNSETVLSGTSAKDVVDGCVCGIYNFNAYVGTLPASDSSSLQTEGLSKFKLGMKDATCAAKPSLQAPSSATQSDGNTKNSAAKTSTGSPDKASGTSSASVSASMTTPLYKAPFSSPLVSRPLFSSPPFPVSLFRPTAIPHTNGVVKPSAPSTPGMQSCIGGYGSENYQGLCAFACGFGYCPPGPCTCTASGIPSPTPSSMSNNAIPVVGLGESYSGLCNFGCSHGYCPEAACQAV